jgi:type I restriction enzyme S subunit
MALCDRLEAARAGREAVRDRLTAATLTRLTAPGTDAEALPAEVGTALASGNATTRSTFPTHARFALQTLPTLTTRPDQIKTLRQTILNLAVRGKLVAQDPTDEPVKPVGIEIIAKKRGQMLETIEEPYDLPQGWAWRAIDTISDQVTDGEHSTPPRISEHEIPLVTAKNVREGFMDYGQTDWVGAETARKAWMRCRPQVGDLLLVCVGATTGRLTVLREQRDMVLVRSVALIRPSVDVDAEYLERAIRSPMGQGSV